MSKSKKKRSHSQSASRQTASRQPAKPVKKKTDQRLWIGLGVIVVLVIAAVLLIQQFSSPAEAPPPLEISTAEAYQKYQDGVFFLDVRTPEEWNQFHAPNSTLIPLEELPARLGELPRDQEIVVVCRSGNRSQEGRNILLNAGFQEVTSMAGGLNEWRSAGYPTMEGP